MGKRSVSHSLHTAAAASGVLAACLFMGPFAGFPQPVKKICVSGIMRTDDGYLAVVNNTIVKEKVTLPEGVTVLKITPESVWFDYDKEVFARKLGNGCVPSGDSSKSARRSHAQETSTSSDGDVYYRQAVALYKKALEAHKHAQIAVAGLYYRKALQYAREALPLADVPNRERLNAIINDYREKKTILSQAVSRIEKRVLPAMESPRRISEWLRENIEYKPDWNLHGKTEYWQTPQETVALGIGDCEDFAFLAQSFLGQLGIEAQVIGIEYMDGAQREGHALCVFPKGAPKYYFNCSRLIPARERTVKDLVIALYPSWIRITELDISKRRYRLFFENPFKGTSR